MIYCKVIYLVTYLQLFGIPHWFSSIAIVVFINHSEHIISSFFVYRFLFVLLSLLEVKMCILILILPSVHYSTE